MGQSPTPSDKKKKVSGQYKPELMYPFYRNAGGNIQEALRLAKAANETRVPKKRQTWATYAVKYDFAEQMKAEEKEKWDKFHNEREANQQRVFDQISSSFEMVAEHFQKKVTESFELIRTLKDDDAKRVSAEKWLERFFGSMADVDRLYRMHLRSRQLPERMTQERLTHEGSVPVTYGDMETKSATPEEAAEKAKESGF